MFPVRSLTHLLVRFALAMCFVLATTSATRGQVTLLSDATAPPVHGAGHNYIGLLNETVNPATGALTIHIGIPVAPGRKLTVPLAFEYNSGQASFLARGSTPFGTCNQGTGNCPHPAGYAHNSSAVGNLTWGGWSSTFPEASYAAWTQWPYGSNGLGINYPCKVSSGFMFKDSVGSAHQFNLSHLDGSTAAACAQTNPRLVEADTASDAYYQAALPYNNSSTVTGWPGVAATDGTVYIFPSSGLTGFGNSIYALPDSIEDSNGNKLFVASSTKSWQPSPNILSVTDTLGRNEIAISTFGFSTSTSTVSASGQSYALNWQPFTPTGFHIATYLNSSSTVCAPIPTLVGANDPSQNTLGVNVVRTISLPNGQQYKFDYDSVTGFVSKITYPSGGYVSYTWGTYAQSSAIGYNDNYGNSGACAYIYDTPAITQRTVSFDGSTIALQQTFSYSTTWSMSNAGANTTEMGQWNTKSTTVTTTDVIAGTTSKVTYNYGWVIGQTPLYLGDNLNGVEDQLTVENTIQHYGYSPSYPLIETETKNWGIGVWPPLLGCSTVTLDNNLVSGKYFNYPFVAGHVVGQIGDIQEYDYGQLPATNPCTSSPPTPARETLITYQPFASTPIFATSPSILDRPSSVKTYGNGTLIAETDISYDLAAVTPASVPTGTHDETSYSAGSAASRGNVTTVTKKCFQSCADSTTKYTYDETGQVLTKVDPCGNATATCSDMTGSNHKTQYFYTDSYSTCSGTAPPAGATNAYLTQIIDPLGHTQSFCYGYTDGQLRGSTDPNNQTTLYKYNDSLARLTETDYPPAGSGGTTYLAYNDSPYNSSTHSPSVTTTKTINSGTNLITMSSMDGLGHIVQTNLTDPNPNCSSGNITKTTYDGFGRIRTVSNPYCSASESNRLTTNSYDALGRTKSVTHPDGTSITINYTGRATQVFDEGNGTQQVSRISQVDGLGRLAFVCEVASGPFVGSGGVSSSSLIGSGGTPASCNLDIGGTERGFLTSYLYDVLDNLKQVSQPGISARTFNYDSLSRLTSASNPESGTTAYVYDSNGNLFTKTDARNITTTFGYDVVNRPLSKGYSDTTPGVTYVYDAASVDSLAVSNPIGRLVKSKTNDGKTATVNSYDPMGRIKSQYQCTPQNCGTSYYLLPYAYDLAGDVVSAGTGMGTTFGYGPFNGAGQLPTMTSSLSDANHPATLFSNATYTAFGALASAKLGNGLNETRSYDTRMRLQSISATNPTGATATAGSGSVTIGGAEQVKPAIAAVAGSGTATLNGSEQLGSGTVSRGTYNINFYIGTVNYSGTVTAYLNGAFLASASFSGGEPGAPIAQSLSNSINNSSLVTSTWCCSGSGPGTVSLTSRATGSNTNYPLTISCTYSGGSCGSYVAASGMSGGTGTASVWDSGSVWITVNGVQTSVPYGQGTTLTGLTSSLASALNAGTLVYATASGSSISITAKSTGANTNYSLSSGSSSTPGFSPPSFSVSVPTALANGRDAAPAIYDSGTATITVNGVPAQFNYGQNDTPFTVTSGLVSAAGATAANASAPGCTSSSTTCTISLVSKTTGSATNYPLSTSVSYNSATFPNPSFTAGPSGPNLTGGTDTTIYSLAINTYAPNGDVLATNDSVNGNWTYGYDPFNRVVGANKNSGAAVYNYVYDIAGNRWQQNGPQTMTLSFTGNASTNNNRADGYSYDLAGNLLNDGTTVYTYDAENRQTSVFNSSGGWVCYLYNAEGQRVRKDYLTSGTCPAPGTKNSYDYLLDLGGHTVSINKNGTLLRNEIYAGNRHLGLYANGTTYFSHVDQLGTERVLTSVTGTSYDTCSSGPFGDGLTCSVPDPSVIHFTGQQRDSVSNLDDFGARYYASNFGRFVSPDPVTMLPERLRDPQQINLYAYTRNNPLRFIDPTGTTIDDSACLANKRCKKWEENYKKSKEGQAQWKKLDDDKKLVVKLQWDNKAKTSVTNDYKWDSSGKLTGAVVTLAPRTGDPSYQMNSESYPFGSTITDSSERQVYVFGHELAHVEDSDTPEGRDSIQEVERLFPDANARFNAEGSSGYAQDKDLQATFAIIRADNKRNENVADKRAKGIVESYRDCASSKDCK